MKVLLAPHPLLSRKTTPVRQITQKHQRMIDDMKRTLLSHRDPIGVGLSANQVGLTESIFIVRENEKNTHINVYINPQIIKAVEGDEKRKPTLEGCLSIPDIWGNVLRPAKVQLAYQDEKGDTQETWFEGYPSIIVQHELDHLNGILFTERVLEQGRQLYKEVDGELEPWLV